MNTFMGIPIEAALFMSALGLIAGLFVPLRPFIRSKLHFTVRPNDEEMLKRDADVLSDIVPSRNKEALIGFCNNLRKIGLTLIMIV